jgi:riboflavin kinase / FMN adenylyltransferase
VTRVVVTIGVFDGVHRGHLAVVGRGSARAREAGERLIAFTFDVPPRAVLSGSPPPPLLTSLGEKVALLRRGGADGVRVLRFTRDLAAKSPQRFLDEHVLAFAPLSLLVVGYDFAMGRDREGTAAVLREIGSRRGFAVEEVPAVWEGGEAISSTRVRRALEEGTVDVAWRCLGRPYRLPGTVVRGDGRGRTLGFPTANLEVDPGRLRPGNGVYAVRVSGASPEIRDGVANLGVRPTFGGGGETVEVHLLDGGGDLVGARLTVSFLGRLRPERKFKEVKELQDQIRADVARAREVLAGIPAAPDYP